jgi:hypothetical protein
LYHNYHPHCHPFFLQGDVLEDDEDYLVDELGQPVVSDGELGGDDPSDASSSAAVAPASRSPALIKKKQHPTYKGSSACLFSLGQDSGQVKSSGPRRGLAQKAEGGRARFQGGVQPPHTDFSRDFFHSFFFSFLLTTCAPTTH